MLIAGGTGNQGGEGWRGVRYCLEQGHDVRVFTRTPSSDAAKVCERLGVKLVHGDFDDEKSLALAMDNADAVVFIHPDLSDFEADMRRATKVVNAARSSPTVSTMVASTAVKTGQHEGLAGWGPAHPMYNYWRLQHGVEMLVCGAGFVSWTILRPVSFLQLFLPPVRDFYFPGFLADQTLRVAYAPTTKIAWIDARDVGMVAAQAISQPALFAGREIDLAAEALTIEQVAERVQEALGTKLRVHYYSDEEVESVRNSGLGVVVASQKWANEVPSHDAAKAAEEFHLTPVSEFFRQNKVL